MLFAFGGFTGIVLSNASLDIALHDKSFMYMQAVTFLSYVSPYNVHDKKIIMPKKLSKQQLEPFFVGLLDGDGSIQVNHWLKRTLQFRIVIKLADKVGNFEMLTTLKDNFGGTVRIANGFVVWAINDSNVIKNVIVPVFTRYPPLTCRKRAQLAFLIKALDNMSVQEYLDTRSNKYNDLTTIDFSNLPNYWLIWLAGFIEAEGSFSYRQVGTFSFSIAQVDDKLLIEAIRNYLKVPDIKVLAKYSKNGTLYEFATGSRLGVENAIKVCAPYLQGHKYLQAAEFTLKVNKTLFTNYF